MEGKRTSNFLLFIIALCLVLIMLKLYSSVDFVREAQAQPAGAVNSLLWGCARTMGNACQPNGWIVLHTNSDGSLASH